MSISNPRRYIDFLPAMFKRADNTFIESYLKIFEKILSGIEDGVKLKDEDGKYEETQSISGVLDTISELFYPDEKIPTDFLNWLSTWVGLVLKEDWDVEKKKDVIANIIPIYRLRGTRTGLEELLKIYIGGGVNVYNNYSPSQIDVNSRSGISTALGAPNFFIVEATLPPDLAGMEPRKKNIKAIIEREKPVHTEYEIRWKGMTTLRVGVKSRVGIDTLLWGYE